VRVGRGAREDGATACTTRFEVGRSEGGEGSGCWEGRALVGNGIEERWDENEEGIGTKKPTESDLRRLTYSLEKNSYAK
jgi:hypothetical protein